jgi:hypothetical protein
MKYFLFKIALVLFVFNGGNCQIPNIEWQKSFGGSDDDAAHSIIINSDTTYTIVGSVKSEGPYIFNHHPPVGTSDVWLFEISKTGNIIWQNCLGGSSYDDGISVIRTMDNKYLITGETDSNDGDVFGLRGSDDIWVIKADTLGQPIWKKCFGGSMLDEAENAIQCSDSGYLVLGGVMSSDVDVFGFH